MPEALNPIGRDEQGQGVAQWERYKEPRGSNSAFLWAPRVEVSAAGGQCRPRSGWVGWGWAALMSLDAC